MHIGLIGGIGPAATDYYYRSLISAFAEQKHPFDITIVHADATTLLGNLQQNDIESQVAIYNRLTDRLISAGAQCVVVTSIAGHFCIQEFMASTSLPVINMLTEVQNAIRQRGFRRVGILGTRTVMESHFYSGIKTAEVVHPKDSLLDQVHGAYVEMAAKGSVTDDQREIFDTACRSLVEYDKVDTVMLGGTDLTLVYDDQEKRFPILDCASVHVEAIVKYATG